MSCSPSGSDGQLRQHVAFVPYKAAARFGNAERSDIGRVKYIHQLLFLFLYLRATSLPHLHTLRQVEVHDRDVVLHRRGHEK